MTQRPSFGRYDREGAYHWSECDRNAPGCLYNPALEARYQVVSRRLSSGGLTLDVGCGDGYLMGQLSPRCREVIGIDPEATAVRLANTMLAAFPNCRALQADCRGLPFPDDCFDTAVMADVVEHLEDPERAVGELARVLKPTGTSFITTPKLSRYRPFGEYHVREYAPAEFEELLRGAFEEVALRYFWPERWLRLYTTRVGWRLLKTVARHWRNPFTAEGEDAERFDQMLAICRRPRSASAR